MTVGYSTLSQPIVGVTAEDTERPPAHPLTVPSREVDTAVDCAHGSRVTGNRP